MVLLAALVGRGVFKGAALVGALVLIVALGFGTPRSSRWREPLSGLVIPAEASEPAADQAGTSQP
jgi:hypothetical protein